MNILYGCEGMKPSDRDEKFRALYDSQREKVFALCWTRLQNRALADEHVQEAFISVYKLWDTIENPETYIMRVAWNRCGKTLRKLSKQGTNPGEIRSGGNTNVEREFDRRRIGQLFEAFMRDHLDKEDQLIASELHLREEEHHKLASRLGIVRRTVGQRKSGIDRRFYNYFRMKTSPEFNALDDLDQKIALAYFVGNRSQEQVSSDLGVKLGRVKKRLKYSRKKVPFLKQIGERRR